ncbi:MAG: chemotaxis protein CheX [Magnetococcus sp. WYHC-3]
MAEPMGDLLNSAVREVADTLPGVVLQAEGARAVPSDGTADLSALVGMSGGVRGCLRLAGERAAILRLAAALLGETRDRWDDELEDAFAELANLVAGGLQGRLEPSLGAIRLTPPSVILGRGQRVFGPREWQCAAHGFSLSGPQFFTEFHYSAMGRH